MNPQDHIRNFMDSRDFANRLKVAVEDPMFKIFPKDTIETIGDDMTNEKTRRACWSLFRAEMKFVVRHGYLRRGPIRKACRNDQREIEYFVDLFEAAFAKIIGREIFNNIDRFINNDDTFLRGIDEKYRMPRNSAASLYPDYFFKMEGFRLMGRIIQDQVDNRHFFNMEDDERLIMRRIILDHVDNRRFFNMGGDELMRRIVQGQVDNRHFLHMVDAELMRRIIPGQVVNRYFFNMEDDERLIMRRIILGMFDHNNADIIAAKNNLRHLYGGI